jgi:hypothetical protein
MLSIPSSLLFLQLSFCPLLFSFFQRPTKPRRMKDILNAPGPRAVRAGAGVLR